MRACHANIDRIRIVEGFVFVKIILRSTTMTVSRAHV